MSRIVHGRVALLTLEASDLQEAEEAITYCMEDAEECKAAIRPDDSIVTSIGNYLSSMWSAPEEPQESDTHAVKNGLLRANLIYAECCVLLAQLYIFQESFASYLKAGVSLHRGYNMFMELWNDVKQLDQPEMAVDKHTLGGIYLGVGAINLFLGALPPRVLRIISVMGYSCDKKFGFELLQKCLDTNGIHTPFALFLMLAYHTYLTSFAPEILAINSLPAADSYLDLASKQYHGGAAFAFMRGRARRLERKLPEAVWSFEDAFTSRQAGVVENVLSKSGWEGIQRMSEYELGLTHLFMLNFKAAATHFSRLADADFWSPATCRYMEAACLEAHGELQQARIRYMDAPSLVVRQYGGRTISVEEYILRKTKRYSDDTETTDDESDDSEAHEAYHQDKPTWLPVLELIALWNGFTCMPPETIEKCRAQVLKLTPNADEMKDEHIVLDWIHACLLKELKQYAQARELLENILEAEHLIQHEHFVKAYASYELGVIGWLEHDWTRAREHWTKARDDYTGYEFENRLALRLHLSISRLDELEQIHHS
jgi:tetratricopeptide (TPR) repeat protein